MYEFRRMLIFYDDNHFDPIQTSLTNKKTFYLFENVGRYAEMNNSFSIIKSYHKYIVTDKKDKYNTLLYNTKDNLLVYIII